VFYPTLRQVGDPRKRIEQKAAKNGKECRVFFLFFFFFFFFASFATFCSILLGFFRMILQ
jgi:hypothetical protein